MNPDLVYLTQTDTTAGFLSQNEAALSHKKKRPSEKPFLISVDSLKTLCQFTRVPKECKSKIRRAKKTTFVYPSGLAIRVIKDEEHLAFMRKLKWSFSTSSNPSGEAFNESFAQEKADVILFTCKGFFEFEPSSILKIKKIKIKKLR